MSLPTGFLMVGCRRLQSLGNPQEFYFVDISHVIAEPLRESLIPLRWYKPTQQQVVIAAGLSPCPVNPSAPVPRQLVLCRSSTSALPALPRQVCQHISCCQKAPESSQTASHASPAGCLRATACLGHLCKRNSRGSKCRKSVIVTTPEPERACQHEDRAQRSPRLTDPPSRSRVPALPPEPPCLTCFLFSLKAFLSAVSL